MTRGFLAALATDALLRCAGDDLVDTLQMRRAVRCGPGACAVPFGWLLSGGLGDVRRRGQRLALALGLDLFARYARLQVEQFELKIAQRLASLAVLLATLLAKTLLQDADLQLCVVEFAALRCELLLLLATCASRRATCARRSGSEFGCNDGCGGALTMFL